MKKILSFALVLAMLFTMSVPAMAAANTNTVKTAALSLTVSYDDEAVLGDSVAVNVTVIKTANGAVDYRVKAGDFDSGHQTYKNNDAAKTFTFYVDCTKTGTAELVVVLEEWQNKNKMNKAVEIVVSVSVECPGHEFINDTGVVFKERTCDEDGAVEAVCSRLGCDAVGTRYLPAHNSWDAGVVTEPTCTEGGFTTYTCQFIWGCGLTKIDNYVPALGHNFNQWKKSTTQERTCTVEGIYEWPCVNNGCDEVCEERIPGFHFMNDRNYEWSVWKLADKAATCTEDGFYGYVCIKCDEAAEDAESITALGHNWDEGVYTNPTREADGYTTYNCTVDGCGAVDVVTDEGSQWVVTGVTADIINQSGNSFQIKLTETYSGGADEVYTTDTIEGSNAIGNNSSADFVIGSHTVTVARGGNKYTVTSII